MAKRKKIDAELDTLMLTLIGMWRKKLKLSGPADELQTREFRGFVTHVKEILELDPMENEGVFEEALKNREKLAAYMLYFFPLRYQEALSLINELPTHGTKALDISIAPSPFALAASKHGYVDVTALGPSLDALNMGVEAAGRLGYPLHIRHENIRALKQQKEQYDLITLSYSLFDLYPSDSKFDVERRKEIVLSLIHSLSKDGFLLIVESSIERKNKRFLELRNLISESGFTIQAPCIHQGKCPALTYKNMCFAQRDVEKPYLIVEANRSGKINMNSLKMSYLIIRSKESAKREESGRNLFRIISPPFDNDGMRTFYLCGTGGRKKLSSTLEEYNGGTKAFEYLKRGEAIEVNAEEEGRTFILTEDSTINVVAPLSKPFMEQ